MTDKTAGAIAIFGYLVGVFIGVILGLAIGSAINYHGHNPPAINCNNMSANDGAQYEERDITDYEYDEFCED